MTSKSPVGDISVVTLIRTDTTLDHSQKAEKVWSACVEIEPSGVSSHQRIWLGAARASFKVASFPFQCVPHQILHCSYTLPLMHASVGITTEVGNQGSRKNSNSHIDASHSRQPLVKGERLVRYEVNAVMLLLGFAPRQRRSQVPEHDAVVLFCVKLPEECGQPFGC